MAYRFDFQESRIELSPIGVLFNALEIDRYGLLFLRVEDLVVVTVV